MAATAVGEQLEKLIAMWDLERLEARARFAQERSALSWKERLERGMAASELSIDELLPSPGGRLVLLLTSGHPAFDRQKLKLRPGDPVVLFFQSAEEPGRLPAIVERWRGSSLGVAIDGDLPEAFEDKPFRLEREAPEATFDKGRRAIERLKSAHGEIAELTKIVYGKGTLERVDFGALNFMDSALDAAQQEAIRHSLETSPIALLHGPPGTGKTRCLVEIIRQCVARGERILAVAPSNVAVDNLVERLVDHRIGALRIGHPARVLPDVEQHTLSARLDAHEGSKLAKSWVAEAHQMKRRAEVQAARGTGDRAARREAFAESRRLLKDARNHLRRVEQAIVSQAPVVCATLTGADASVLREQRFDRVVMDEATQAVDPLAWIPLTMAPRIVLAGDPHQLPPTVLSDVASRQGLSMTIFERLVGRIGASAVRMLVTQHRMHEDIMAFPSKALYQGALVASPEVARHTLEDLGVIPDPDRPGARVFIDAAGAGWVEQKREPDLSTLNPELADRTAFEVERLLSRGLNPADCAVITPYDAQVGALRARLATHLERGLEVGSIDGFQGREKEAVVLDLVRSNDKGELGFLAEIRRMNVAITRARRFLLVLGDSATLGEHAFYSAFFADVDERGTWVSAFSESPALAEPLVFE